MITEAHKRNYEQYVRPYLGTIWPDALKIVKDRIKLNIGTNHPKYDQATLKRMSVGYIMQLVKSVHTKGTRDKAPLVINEHPHVVLSDIYIGMWYDELVAEIQAERAMHPMASQFLDNQEVAK